MAAITEASSLEDVCFAVCTALRDAGTVAVLTGGSAATYYAPESYQSGVYTVEFPPGPLPVGADIVRSYQTVTRGDEILYVLSRTDCVRDRLAAFYFFSDRSALAAALAVANSGPADLVAIRQWSQKEGEAQRFAEFAEAL